MTIGIAHLVFPSQLLLQVENPRARMTEHLLVENARPTATTGTAHLVSLSRRTPRAQTLLEKTTEVMTMRASALRTEITGIVLQVFQSPIPRRREEKMVKRRGSALPTAITGTAPLASPSQTHPRTPARVTKRRMTATSQSQPVPLRQNLLSVCWVSSCPG